MDRRLTPANSRVAAMHLAGQVDAERFVAGWPMVLLHPVTDLCAKPDGPRDRQLLKGAAVTVFEDYAGWSFVQTANDYVGYVPTDRLGPPASPTHIVASAATHAYSADDFKSPDVMALPLGAGLTIVDERRKFYETDVGFVPKRHLRPVDKPFSDPATVAQIHFGVPYLWGGNSTRGIDCSGLVSASLSLCGIPCGGDCDMQQTLGQAFTDAPRRGDLILWKTHVGIMVDETTMIHANAHNMAVTYEPLDKAIPRIEAQGEGPVSARRRLF